MLSNKASKVVLRQDGDQILLDAAAGGASLADLGGLTGEMAARTATPERDRERDDGFTGRRARLDLTFAGAGLLAGKLTPACAAALAAVLESLGPKAGPEDTRTPVQRDHDALEEVCRRLAAVHRWGWSLTLHGDGTVTARNPNHQRTLHSHSPPVPAT